MQDKKGNTKEMIEPRKASDRPRTGDLVQDILAAAATPFILFVSTTNSLYLGNQEDLAYQVSVLYPFLELFGGTWLVGFLLFRLTVVFQNRLMSIIRWAYMMLGPFFLVFVVLHIRYPSRMDSIPYYGGMFGIYILTVIAFVLKGGASTVKKILAVVTVLLCFLEGYQFASQVGKGVGTFKISEAKINTSPERAEMPNVYHIVFDAFQTDLFEQTLTSETEDKLAEFRFFSDTTTPFGRTRMALAATFLGRPYDYSTPMIDYQRDAYNSKQSFLFSLVEVGYDTMAIVHPVHAFKQPLFHQVIPLKEYADIKFIQDNWFLFRNLWLFALLPKGIACLVVPPEDMIQMEKKNLLPDVAPIYSYSAFQKFLAEEGQMAAHNRYFFMHLILPHLPNVLRTDGTFGQPMENGEIPKTSSLEQACCATNMIVALAERLKALDRFNESLIIIHGDHGSGYEEAKLKGVNSLEKHWGRSRPLLLVKPVHNTDAGCKFQVNEEEVTLYDIAPTVLDSLQIPAKPGRFTGISLALPSLPKERGKRQYHWFEKKGWHGWTDRMEKYVIENDTIQREEDVQLFNNPKIQRSDFL